MTEEEIIKKLNELLKHKNDYDICWGLNIYHPYAMGQEDYVPIEQILDLYNKEKEKNAKQGKIIKSIQTIDNYCIREEYISKDKIRDLIAERKFELQQEYEDFENDIKLKILEELLEE